MNAGSYGNMIQASSAFEKKENLLSGIMGIAAMLANLLVIIVFLKDRTLRERRLFIIRGLGDFLCGAYFSYGGFARLKVTMIFFHCKDMRYACNNF